MFQLRENGTTLRTELLAGCVTFLTMAYIIVVQPAVLSGRALGLDTGMDFNALVTVTCLASAGATLLMGLWARYPIALAPGMGQNYFFVLSAIPAAAAIPGVESPWQVALGAVFVAGVLFLILSLSGVREALLNALSPSMKNAIAVGIGLFIAFIGLQGAGLIVDAPGTLVTLNPDFASPDLVVFFFGLLLSSALHAARVPGSILWGLIATALLAVGLRAGLPNTLWGDAAIVAESQLLTRFELATALVSTPPSPAPLLGQLDLWRVLCVQMIPIVIIFLFMDLFDTLGTLVGVAEQAGFMENNRLPRANRALLADSLGTVGGAWLGTSPVTCFVESAAGVEQGGRTGLTAITVAVLFLLAMPLSPLVAMVGSYPPIYAPALVLVGSMMAGNVAKIDWNDRSEAIPAFLTIIGIPLCYSIADGLALGLIAYPIIKRLSSSPDRVGWLMYLLAAVLVAYLVFVRT